MNDTDVLLSGVTRRLSIGTKEDVESSIEQHRAGHGESPRCRRPLTLSYYEARLSPEVAWRRERTLRSGRGGRYVKRCVATSPFLIAVQKLERH